MKKLKKLTKEVALQDVEVIRECSNDNEAAHSYEDSLYYWFIDCVSAGMYEKNEAIEIAKIVKSTSKINFDRWYA